jgi:CRP-like cAMP-binding protein
LKINNEQLQKFSIFAGLSSNQLESIHKIILEKKYKNGEDIIREDEKCDDFFLLFRGQVEVSKSLTLLVGRRDVDTRDKSLIHLKAEDAPYFGEMCLVRKDSKRSATVKAINECIVGIIKRDSLNDLCEIDAEMGYKIVYNIATTLAERLEKANQDIMKLTTAFSLSLQY